MRKRDKMGKEYMKKKCRCGKIGIGKTEKRKEVLKKKNRKGDTGMKKDIKVKSVFPDNPLGKNRGKRVKKRFKESVMNSPIPFFSCFSFAITGVVM